MMQLDLTNKKTQYILGFTASILYFLILLLSSPTSFANLQVPEGKYINNQWCCADFITYYQPAKNFLETGVFGYGLNPDYSRPLGYQVFIAMLIVVFGKCWIYAAYIIQSALFALIYPVLTSILQLFSNPSKNQIKYTFLFSLLSGIYVTRSIYIGPDVMLSFLLITGIYYTIKTIKYQNWKYTIPAFLLISYGALVRPTLIYYPLIHLVIVFLLGKTFNNLSKLFTKYFLITTTLLFLITCNLPSIRNYLNYGIFKPTIILQANYYDYLSKKVLLKENQADYFYKTKAQIESNPLKIQLEQKKDTAIKIIKQYPVTTLKVIFIDNAKSVLIDNHIVNFTGNFYGYNWKPFQAPEGCYSLKGSQILYGFFWIFAILYVLVYILFIISMYNLFKAKKYLLCFSILLIIFIFLAPSIIIGDGGARFRYPFEWLIVLVAFKTDIAGLLKRLPAFGKLKILDQLTYGHQDPKN